MSTQNVYYIVNKKGFHKDHEVKYCKACKINANEVKKVTGLTLGTGDLNFIPISTRRRTNSFDWRNYSDEDLDEMDRRNGVDFTSNLR